MKTVTKHSFVVAVLDRGGTDYRTHGEPFPTLGEAKNAIGVLRCSGAAYVSYQIHKLTVTTKARCVWDQLA